jgi:hypothetical protein
MTIASLAYHVTMIGDNHLSPADLRRIRAIGDRAKRERPATADRPPRTVTQGDSGEFDNTRRD